MRGKTQEDRQLLDLLDPVAEACGYAIVRLRLMSGRERRRLQVMAERPEDGDMGIDDCTRLSRAISDIFDAAPDLVNGEFVLEVSSPGIDRPLTRLKDFETYAGLEARLELDRMAEGRKRFKGELAGLDGDNVAIDLEGDEHTALIPFSWIVDAKLVLNDELMARGAAARLVGTLAHPLNRPRLEPREGRVVEGYGILQPRIAPTLPSEREGSLFRRVFSGPAGIDPYSAAVSDVYQDLFAEGSYTGKGIYDIDAFERALEGRVPENTLLSHDLFEGLFARAALVTDMAERTHVWGALDNLEALKKGGRIGGAKAMLATALSIKPIIEVRDGAVHEGGKQRTRAKALAFLVDKFRSFPVTEGLAVMHADCSDIDQFLDMLRPYTAEEILVGEIGAVIGTHAGRGTIGLGFRTP